RRRPAPYIAPIRSAFGSVPIRPVAPPPLAGDRMPDRPDISIVIPCLNESASIASVVRQAHDALERLGYRGEVVVCDNGSTDGSRADAEQAGARVVHQPIRGYGAACLRGMEASCGDLVVIVDGDGTYDLSLLHRFVEPLRA